MTATRDFLEATSNEFNQAVIRAKEAVTGQKSARIATRCRQVLEDAWTKYNTAYAQYAAKLKEPATKAEAQGVWLGEMRSYEVALDALEEYLEDQQGLARERPGRHSCVACQGGGCRRGAGGLEEAGVVGRTAEQGAEHQSSSLLTTGGCEDERGPG